MAAGGLRSFGGAGKSEGASHSTPHPAANPQQCVDPTLSLGYYQLHVFK